MTPSGKDYLHLHFVVLIWGFTAILGKLISIPPVEMVFYRTVLAALGIGLYALYKNKNLKYNTSVILKLLFIGFLVAAHWILFFLSARISSVSVSLVGIATTAFWTSLLEPLMTKRKIKWIEVVLGLVVILGLYIIFYYEFNVATGLMIAIVSAIIASIFTIINSKFAKTTNPYAVAFYEMSGASLGIALFFPLYISFFSSHKSLQLSLDYMDIVYLLVLAFLCTDYAYTASIHLMKKISAYTVNLTINLEPIYGMLLAVLIFKDDEVLTFQFYIGASLIILSVLLYPVLNKLFFRKPLEVDNLR